MSAALAELVVPIVFGVLGLVAVGLLVRALVRGAREAGAADERGQALEKGNQIHALLDEANSAPLRAGAGLWARLRARARADELRRDDPPAE